MYDLTVLVAAGLITVDTHGLRAVDTHGVRASPARSLPSDVTTSTRIT